MSGLGLRRRGRTASLFAGMALPALALVRHRRDHTEHRDGGSLSDGGGFPTPDSADEAYAALGCLPPTGTER